MDFIINTADFIDMWGEKYMGYKERQKVKEEVIVERQEEQQKEKWKWSKLLKIIKKEMAVKEIRITILKPLHMNGIQ